MRSRCPGQEDSQGHGGVSAGTARCTAERGALGDGKRKLRGSAGPGGADALGQCLPERIENRERLVQVSGNKMFIIN